MLRIFPNWIYSNLYTVFVTSIIIMSENDSSSEPLESPKADKRILRMKSAKETVESSEKSD